MEIVVNFLLRCLAKKNPSVKKVFFTEGFKGLKRLRVVNKMNKELKELRERDEIAFRTLVKNYQSRIFHHAMQILRNREEAEDVCQETFVQVFQSICSFKGDSSLSTWIIRIAIHLSLEKIRKQKRRNRLREMLPWWMPSEEKSADFMDLNPGIQLENKEKAIALYRAIDQLSANQRVAFTLIKIDEITYAEASELMNLSIKAIESLVSRAKENIKKQLK
jgi:RNA polymerase sigma-70 factor (ECF subfamily)